MTDPTKPGAVKPCPFCGSRKIAFLENPTVGRDFYCEGCGASVTWFDKKKEETPALWNRRAPASAEARNCCGDCDPKEPCICDEECLGKEANRD